jgi:hypothetical protein
MTRQLKEISPAFVDLWSINLSVSKLKKHLFNMLLRKVYDTKG